MVAKTENPISLTCADTGQHFFPKFPTSEWPTNHEMLWNHRSAVELGASTRASSSIAATQPIEINNPFGSGTCMVIRAGGLLGKNSVKRRLSSAKLDTSATRTVVFTTRS